MSSNIKRQDRTVMEMNDMWGSISVIADADARKKSFFMQSKYAMFIHWGLYSQSAGRWDGCNCYGISEWIMQRQKIHPKQYEALAAQFNPERFNASTLVSKIKSWGMRYLVITAKHHDGFAMFKSSHPFNIVDATPCGRDILKELADECARQNLRLGLYYSQYQDWHEWNSWGAEGGTGIFNDYFYGKCLPQIQELLTGYGKLSMMWFDTPGLIAEKQSRQIVDLVHEFQPDALINSRIGNDVGEYVTFGDQEIPAVNTSGLWESIDTINRSWGYTWYDTDFADEKRILRQMLSVVARGGNYMINAGLDGKGEIPQLAELFLNNAGKWLVRYGYAVYGASSSPWQVAQCWGEATRQGKRLYLFLFDYTPGMKVELYGLPAGMKTVKFQGRNMPLPETDGAWIVISLPFSPAQDTVELLELEFDSEIPDICELNVGSIYPTKLPVDMALCQNCALDKHSWMENFGEWKHLSYVCLGSGDATLSWNFELHLPGLYRIEIDYGNVRQRAWKITSDENESIHFWSQNANDDHKTVRFRQNAEGIIRFHVPGLRKLIFQCEDKLNFDGLELTDNPSIDIHAIRLIPLIDGLPATDKSYI